MKCLLILLWSANAFATGMSGAGVSSSRILNTPLTGYVSGSGTVTSADTILTALEKLSGGGGGSVTAVTASSPLFSSGGTAPDITCQLSSGSQSGCLTSTDWTTFNGKESALTFSAPLSRSTNTISIPVSTSSANGYLSSTDWSTFNSKVSTNRAINTTSPITGGGDLSADRTIACNVASGSQPGCLASADWTTFNNKQAAGSYLTAGNNLSDVSNASTARTNLGVAIGVNVEAWDGDLDALAAISSTGLLARTGAGTASVRTITGTANHITVTNGDGVSGNPTIDIPARIANVAIGFTIDGGGNVITTGLKGCLEMPYAGTISGWTIVSDVSGSAVIDVWSGSYSTYPLSVSNTITGADKPTLSSQQKNQNLTLSAWTTSLSLGDFVCFNVDSATTVTRVLVSIRVSR